MQQSLHEATKRWVQYIKRRIKKNKNFLGAFIGQTGSGKSYSAVSLGDIIMDFNIPKENICFTSRDFVKRLSEGLRDKTLPKGSVLIWDESGVDLNAKEWQSRINKLINRVLQTFRTENIIVFFTVPYLSFIDSDTRKLLHAYFQTEHIDRNNNLNIVRPYNLQTNQVSGKMYRKCLKVDHLGSTIRIKRITLPLPRKELVDYYENISSTFKRNVIDDTNRDLEMIELKKKSKISAYDPLTARQREIYDLVLQGKTIKEIAKMQNISIPVIWRHLQSCKLKGFNIKIDKSDKENEVFSSNNHILPIMNLT